MSRAAPHALFTAQGFADALGPAAAWRVEPAHLDAPITGVSTDTRTLAPGQAFVALRGERFDAHAFLADALRCGASVAVIDARASVDDDVVALTRERQAGLLAVDAAGQGDAGLLALHRLARAWRDALAHAACRVIAVAGSNGKTTTRHLIHHVLDTAPASATAPATKRQRLTGHQSPRSYNNHIGVPLTLLGAAGDDDFVVCELGTNHVGELAPLAALARPDIGVLTCLGREHLEHFGSVDAVAREEASLLHAIDATGTAIVHDDAWAQLERLGLADVACEVITFGEGDAADWRLVARGRRDDGAQQLTVRDPGGAAHEVTLTLPGVHNAVNALAALAVARLMQVPVDHAAARLADVAAVPGRLHLRQAGPVRIIDDAYNANPDSMRSGLATLLETPVTAPGRRVAILGDMLELGEHAPAEHRALGQRVADSDDAIALAILVGPMAMFAAETLARHWPGDRVLALPTLDDRAADDIAQRLHAGDVVLVKASRGLALERVVHAIEQRWTDAATNEHE